MDVTYSGSSGIQGECKERKVRLLLSDCCFSDYRHSNTPQPFTIGSTRSSKLHSVNVLQVVLTKRPTQCKRFA